MVDLILAAISIVIDLVYFEDIKVFSILALIWPLIWLMDFSVSGRVRRVFKTLDWGGLCLTCRVSPIACVPAKFYVSHHSSQWKEVHEKMRSRRHATARWVSRLERMFPSVASTTASLKSVLASTRGFDYPGFPEPKRWLPIDSNNRIEFDLDADLLAAWIHHMSHSSRLRMEILENATLRSLVHSEVIAAATLARAHMEAAAWAAYANEELVTVAEASSWARLTKLVPKMLYGTALAKEAKHLSEVRQTLSGSNPPA